MPDTDTTTTKNLWCATCGTYRGTTDRPRYGPHRPPWTDRFRPATCTDTDTFIDD